MTATNVLTNGGALPAWKVVVIANRCLRCGHIWLGRGDEDPIACSHCKSAYYKRAPKEVVADKQVKHKPRKDS